ncbi:MAG TPA: hypothetical protein VE912_15280 [Bacteroidales bacterium]|nr:hypothetical protein [Bacteroidales bacterium]
MLLKKATKEDIKPIHMLFSKYFGDKIDIQFFTKIYCNYWDSDEDFFGYVLYDKEDAVAFCGYIFYDRFINGEHHKFCNFSGWVVEKEYRREYKTTVLEPLFNLAEQGYTLIGLSPTHGAYRVEKQLGFKDLETGKIQFTMNPLKLNFFNKIEIGIQKTIKDDLCSNEIIRIHQDHLTFVGLDRIFMKIDNQEIYLIYSSFTKKKIFKMMEIMYISNPPLFFNNLDSTLNALFLKFGFVGIRVESRFVPEKLKNTNKYLPFRKPHIYYSNRLKPAEIDLLYTERFLTYHLPQ